jgi:hypothetical protein
MRGAIGREHTNPLSKTKASRVRGYTPTSIEKKTIRTTQRTGIAALASPFAESRSM